MFEKKDMKKKDGEGEEEEKEGMDNGEGEEEEEEKSGCKKSLSEDDLESSLSKLEKLGKSEAPARKQILLEKAQSMDLSKSEQDELYDILGGSVAADSEDTLADEVTKGLQENETLQKALDVSDFLSENHGENLRALETLSTHMEKSDNRQHEFNLLLSKGVAETGRLVQSVASRLGVIEAQPARAPKSSGATPMQKSFGGQPAPSNGQLSKSQILDELDLMVQESVAKGFNGATEDGFDLIVASTNYESSNQIAPSLVKAIQDRVKSRGMH